MAKRFRTQGIAFEGSPRDVFWGGFIEPFLKDLVIRSIDRTVTLAQQRGLSSRDAVADNAYLLKRVVSSAYRRMREIDHQLRRSDLLVQQPTAVPIDGLIERMNAFVDQIVAGRLAPKPFMARLSDFYEAHPLMFWAVGVLVSVLIAIFL